jgi:hypothetical protein
MKRSLSLAGGLLAGGLMLGAGTAHAHIDMLGALKSRGGDEKEVPCDGARADGTVYMFEPGATVTLGVTEAISHPSYFRIAFDNDGEDGFKEPASILPIDKTRACPFNSDDQCGKSDFCNVKSTTGATVLWDNLDPHLAGAGTGQYTWTIKLPNVECTNCTLQILQVMEDTVHGAYCPQGSCAQSCSSLIPGLSTCSDGSAQDIYHRCVNITLKKGVGTSGPGNATGPVTAKGVDCLAGEGGGDAGVSGDAGAVDSGVPPATQVDASTATGTRPGDAGGVISTSTGATTGGGSTTSVGGTGTGTSPGVSAGTAGGATGTTVSPATGTAGGTGGVPTGTAGGTQLPASNDDDGGCSVASGSRRNAVSGAVTLSLLALSFVARRRRVRRPR